MPDSDKESMVAQSAEVVARDPRRDERGRMLPGHTINPSGRPAGRGSILAYMQRRLAENPDPETGEGRLAQHIGDLILSAVQESLTNRDHKVLIDLQPAIALLNRIDPPKYRYEKKVIKRLVINGCALPRFTDEKLTKYVETSLIQLSQETIDAGSSPSE